MRDDLYDIVTGDEQAPSSTDNQAVVSFRKRKQKALSTIALSIAQLHLVGEATDPKLLWEKLQSQFQRPTWANRLRVQKRIFNLKLGPSDSIQDHLRTFTPLFEELAAIGDPMKEESKVITFTCFTP